VKSVNINSNLANVKRKIKQYMEMVVR